MMTFSCYVLSREKKFGVSNLVDDKTAPAVFSFNFELPYEYLPNHFEFFNKVLTILNGIVPRSA